MPKYKVVLEEEWRETIHRYYHLEIEAGSQDEAVQKAYQADTDREPDSIQRDLHETFEYACIKSVEEVKD